ncbi:formate dehydrogenase accessory sulfurtransferase FdhD [Polluticoccus soli]|uniref:formate dehydrogenase accessory sulfurtransferase FdhD n=1 Tax=Polluticoccus soli TaxID=3034150 RepID=UPI0023E11385|nr:formate dehydrogenase accessory sulfurtransferase FdhD [Flavipsychrobacter sp. JY13-12]
MKEEAIIKTEIHKVSRGHIAETDDVLAIEEPLEIRLVHGPADKRMQKNLSVTMRTPGNDKELATGFLFTEGIISDYSHVKAVLSNDNIITIIIDETVELELNKLERNFYTTSSCGVCGKSSIDAVKTVCKIPSDGGKLTYPARLIYTLPDLLRKQQDVFESTGGLHASALFDAGGNLLLLREDVGRHNALDKLIGAVLERNMLPLDNHLLLLSGRASFELLQKATMAGIKIVAAVGAPSSLAVQMAKESGITLIGFLRDNRFNIYTGEQRIIL